MKVLYICTHNRCRSILSEAITNHLSQGEIEAKSAGSQPSGQVHPLTLKYLQDAGISIEGLHSQSWDELEEFEPDVVITVCDSAANETCPIWFGKAIKIHWGLADPSKIEGTEAEIANAFHTVISEISKRVAALKNIAHIQQPEQLKQALIALGANEN